MTRKQLDDLYRDALIAAIEAAAARLGHRDQARRDAALEAAARCRRARAAGLADTVVPEVSGWLANTSDRVREPVDRVLRAGEAIARLTTAMRAAGVHPQRRR